MSELQRSLKKLLDGVPVVSVILPFAFVLALIYPVTELISVLAYARWYYSVFQTLLYIIYLAGLVMCFAQELNWAIGAAFGLRALASLVSMLRYTYITFSQVLSLVFYAALAVYFLWGLIMSLKYMGSGAGANNAGTPGGARGGTPAYCPQCGTPVAGGGNFCPNCGTKIQQPRQSRPYGGGGGPYGGPGEWVYATCGNLLALVLSILLTASIFFHLIANFGPVAVLGQIPVILICVACWVIYVGSRNRRPMVATGFTLLSGVMIFYIIFLLILLFVMALVVIYVAYQFASVARYFGSSSGGVVPATVFAILLLVLCGVLWTFFWIGMRKTTVSARGILRGTETEWSTSLFSIILACIGAVVELIMMAGSAALYSTLYRMMEGLSYYYGSEMNSILGQLLNSLGGSHGLRIFCSLLDIAVIVVAVVILFRIRGAVSAQNPPYPPYQPGGRPYPPNVPPTYPNQNPTQNPYGGYPSGDGSTPPDAGGFF